MRCNFKSTKGIFYHLKIFLLYQIQFEKEQNTKLRWEMGRQWGSGLPMLTALDFSTDWGIEPSCWAQVLIEAFALRWASTILVLKRSIRNRDYVCVLKHKIQSNIFKVQHTLFYYFKKYFNPLSSVCVAVCLPVCLSVWGTYEFLWCGHLSIGSQKAISSVSTYLSNLLETKSPCCSLPYMLE